MSFFWSKSKPGIHISFGCHRSSVSSKREPFFSFWEHDTLENISLYFVELYLYVGVSKAYLWLDGSYKVFQTIYKGSACLWVISKIHDANTLLFIGWLGYLVKVPCVM